ncbi:putative uncharacterized protein DDB_G0290521 [Brachypodium distachyon]|uniref:No apical meristem-associated C-terminal domain-containing protein n=1 Tax=Brachypodium distachyon TaxID=15368 RepID=I1H0Y2_BRADI|nr:putative uncharacterized protein DDB_G0290521 [Brachypodium distachyon]KQK19562.1 hypothetical protein BRADI_1g49050v3 [Brachypodium distachyon]|eukprot:XP_003561088.1 putative uncharacterized protein DDB_G0290521 [Brachypodium distachyon]
MSAPPPPAENGTPAPSAAPPPKKSRRSLGLTPPPAPAPSPAADPRPHCTTPAPSAPAAVDLDAPPQQPSPTPASTPPSTRAASGRPRRTAVAKRKADSSARAPLPPPAAQPARAPRASPPPAGEHEVLDEMPRSKWASSMEQVERLNPSGTNPDDRIKMAQKLFMQLTSKNGKLGKPFGLQHCYDLLVHDEKWRTMNYEMPTKKSESSSSSSPDVQNLDGSSNESDSEGANTSNSEQKKRPIGRKKGKERLKKEKVSSFKDSIDLMLSKRKALAAERKEEKAREWMERKEMDERWIAIAKRRAEIAERRAAIAERGAMMEERMLAIEKQKLDRQLMSTDPSKLDEKGRAYFEFRRAQIMASQTTGAFTPGCFLGGGGDMGGGADGSI